MACFKYIRIAALALTLTSCASVELIAPYDATIDQDITALQTSTLTFLTTIASSGGSSKADATSSSHTKFYNDSQVALSVLETRAYAISDNQITYQMLTKLGQQFDALKKQDQTSGISTLVAQNSAKAFNETFQALLTLEVAKKSLSTSSSSSSAPAGGASH
jgi:hypothetical protein